MSTVVDSVFLLLFGDSGEENGRKEELSIYYRAQIAVIESILQRQLNGELLLLRFVNVLLGGQKNEFSGTWNIRSPSISGGMGVVVWNGSERSVRHQHGDGSYNYKWWGLRRSCPETLGRSFARFKRRIL